MALTIRLQASSLSRSLGAKPPSSPTLVAYPNFPSIVFKLAGRDALTFNRVNRTDDAANWSGKLRPPAWISGLCRLRLDGAVSFKECPKVRSRDSPDLHNYFGPDLFLVLLRSCSRASAEREKHSNCSY